MTISENQGESHFGLSNLSFTPINYPDPNTALDKQYPTPEHLFQAMKVRSGMSCRCGWHLY